MRAIILCLSLFVLVLASCQSHSPGISNELIISAAVSLKDAFNEVARLNEQRTGIKIHFNFGASGALQKQIEAGAPADLFASAGAKQMDELAARNLLVPSSRTNFARNVLVLIVPGDRTTITSFGDLKKPEIKKIAVGNPKTVPAGQYTEQTFSKLQLTPDIQPKLIYTEDVRQVLDYVMRDEVDAGVVYSTDTLIGGNTIKNVARAPDDSHDPIVYPIAIINSKQTEAARKFIDLLLSSEGQAILVRHGFASIK